MSFLDFVGIMAGYTIGTLAVQFAVKRFRRIAVRRRRSVLVPVGRPSAAEASERGDLAGIPKQNFWR